MVCRIRVFFFCGDGLRGRGRGADLEKYGGEVHCAKYCDEPLKAKIVSAEASTIFESHLHCTISAFTPIFFKSAAVIFGRRPGHRKNFNRFCLKWLRLLGKTSIIHFKMVAL